MLLDNFIKAGIKNFLKWVFESDDSNPKDNIQEIVQGYVGHAKQPIPSREESLPITFRFTVTNATGGKVVTVLHYDQHTQRHHENVYIVTDKENLGEELGLILSRENLSK